MDAAAGVFGPSGQGARLVPQRLRRVLQRGQRTRVAARRQPYLRFHGQRSFAFPGEPDTGQYFDGELSLQPGRYQPLWVEHPESGGDYDEYPANDVHEYDSRPALLRWGVAGHRVRRYARAVAQSAARRRAV